MKENLISQLAANLVVFRNENLFVMNQIRGRSLLIYAYAIIILASVIAFFAQDFLKEPTGGKKQEKKEKKTSPNILFVISITVFFIMSALQFAYQVRYFLSEMKTYSGKTERQKNIIKFGPAYEFAVFCKEKLPGRHRAEYVSDYSVDEPIGLMLRYRLAYYIYPINIRVPTDDPVDAYVVFQKKEPDQAVPPEYSKRFYYSPLDMLAVKEDAK